MIKWYTHHQIEIYLDLLDMMNYYANSMSHFDQFNTYLSEIEND